MRKLLACLALLALPASAQAQRWYTVELIVFAQPGGSGAEQWQAEPALAYPGAARFLLQPARLDAALATHEGEAELDEFGRLLITAPGLAPPEAAPAFDTASAAADAAPQTAPDESVELPTAFLTLPATQREFRGKAAYMQRNGGYRILFHEIWAQPVVAESAALPIVLDHSGDEQRWPQLQGSVRLHLSRYLHLETNLWLNTMGEYLAGTWRMPAPPLGPPAVIVETPEPPLSDPAATQARGPEYLTIDANGAVSAGAAHGQDATLPAAGAVASEGLQPVAVTAQPLYPFRHAVLLQQKRRMRSNEVHYIDHPMLGVIVKLTPLDDEALWELAQAEAARDDLPPALFAAGNGVAPLTGR